MLRIKRFGKACVFWGLLDIGAQPSLYLGPLLVVGLVGSMPFPEKIYHVVKNLGEQPITKHFCAFDQFGL